MRRYRRRSLAPARGNARAGHRRHRGRGGRQGQRAQQGVAPRPGALPRDSGQPRAGGRRGRRRDRPGGSGGLPAGLDDRELAVQPADLVLGDVRRGAVGDLPAAPRSRVGPFQVGRRHVHHFVPGTVIAFAAGTAAIISRDEALEPAGRPIRHRDGPDARRVGAVAGVRGRVLEQRGPVERADNARLMSILSAVALALRFLRRGEEVVLEAHSRGRRRPAGRRPPPPLLSFTPVERGSNPRLPGQDEPQAPSHPPAGPQAPATPPQAPASPRAPAPPLRPRPPSARVAPRPPGARGSAGLRRERRPQLRRPGSARGLAAADRSAAGLDGYAARLLGEQVRRLADRRARLLVPAVILFFLGGGRSGRHRVTTTSRPAR